MRKILMNAAIAAASLALSGCSMTTNNNYTDSASDGSRTAAGVSIEKDSVPTDVRRVTIIVRDMEKSLGFYRDALGLEVNYDSTMQFSGVNLPVGEPGSMGRLVLLNGNDPWIGWIGLIEMVDPALPDTGPYPKRLTAGSAVIVVNTDDVEKRCAAAAEVPDVTVTAAPNLQVYPGRNGGPDIRVMGCNVLDPDGIAIEINRILD